MKTRLINLWEKLRATYWFLPGLMALGALLLAFLVGTLDRLWGSAIAHGFAWIGGTEPEGARAFLSTVAGTTITVTGVVFSITIVALSLASQQFGPRLLNGFMRDEANQMVFGVFVATYLYCLLVLRTIQGNGPGGFVPQLSLLVGFLLAVFSVGVLIFFIHHIAASIQAMTVIANVSHDLQGAIAYRFPRHRRVTPEQWTVNLPSGVLPEDFVRSSRPAPAEMYGYIQAVNLGGLLRLARDSDVLLCMECRPGDFLVRGAPLVTVWPGAAVRDEQLRRAINEAFIFGGKRSQEQDIEFLIDQLSEIAVRALSPGVNDPYTALNCIDYLGSALSELAGRELPPPWHFDDQGRLRLIVREQTFESALSTAFDQIRRYGRSDAAVTLSLLKTISVILSCTRNETQRQALLRQAAMVERGSREGLPEEEDRRAVREQYLRVFDILVEHFGLSGEFEGDGALAATGKNEENGAL